MYSVQVVDQRDTVVLKLKDVSRSQTFMYSVQVVEVVQFAASVRWPSVLIQCIDASCTCLQDTAVMCCLTCLGLYFLYTCEGAAAEPRVRAVLLPLMSDAKPIAMYQKCLTLGTGNYQFVVVERCSAHAAETVPC